ncbi:AIPR family protein [bacterium]|nr:AIPR family protein [bacterium]
MISNNTILLDECTNEYILKNEILDYSEDRAFDIFASLLVTKEHDLSFEEIEKGITDGGGDGGIDSFNVLVDNRSVFSIDECKDIKISGNSRIAIYLSQFKRKTSFQEDVLDKILVFEDRLFDLSAETKSLLSTYNSTVVERICIFHEIWKQAVKKNAEMNITFIYCCRANNIETNPAFKEKLKIIQKKAKAVIPTTSVVFNLFSAKELLSKYQEKESNCLELKFQQGGLYPISFASNESDQEEYGYIGLVNLNHYLDFISDDTGNILEHIFDSNIRHYQGEVDVNNMIRKTLETDMQRDFWWLNNGITIIVSECRFTPDILFLDNPQVVNGLQTSYSIFKYYKDNPSNKRSILVKVITTNNKETVAKIISASNSQNPIPPTLLRATDDIQRFLELFFEKKGYYYDRQKNYYKNQGKPASKIFSIQFAAQSIEAIINFSPSLARSKPTTLIKNDKKYNQIFAPDREFEAYLKCCLIHRKMYSYAVQAVPSKNSKHIRNFAFHFSRIFTSIYTGKVKYNHTDISKIDISLITQNHFKIALDILIELLAEYTKEFSEENMINIAKADKFSKFINDNLESILAKREII